MPRAKLVVHLHIITLQIHHRRVLPSDSVPLHTLRFSISSYSHSLSHSAIFRFHNSTSTQDRFINLNHQLRAKSTTPTQYLSLSLPHSVPRSVLQPSSCILHLIWMIVCRLLRHRMGRLCRQTIPNSHRSALMASCMTHQTSISRSTSLPSRIHPFRDLHLLSSNPKSQASLRISILRQLRNEVRGADGGSSEVWVG